ncbi:DUF2271 domain-containing protein [Gilvimarinus sp. 1_MG-2023]|uniref:DUF2271 domain-containing protein n=1 Tax=Gilvimarinus sp. 1_MG-2023 TaxID=3062638 RepID=UPI0026E3E5F6|nr:DUF2271 domain-containing protein [Gilvimarinus sp. 1_MG-2023]MDO6745829.1 DUF2271 domain-containing protein [Gilvimarinus sp. 1_MG-2023]
MSVCKQMMPLLLAGIGAPLAAAQLTVDVAIPEMDVAEYHRPYVAIWVQNIDSKAVTNGAVWYQIDADGEGEKWLKDMRLWWRRSGRSLDMPIDGVTGPTRKPGSYNVNLDHVTENLEPGQYQLYVEASREVGGRELLHVDFDWPLTKAQTLTAQGKTELGKLSVTFNP